MKPPPPPPKDPLPHDFWNYTECGMQRTAVAMALLLVVGLLGLGAIVGLVVADLMGDSQL